MALRIENPQTTPRGRSRCRANTALAVLLLAGSCLSTTAIRAEPPDLRSPEAVELAPIAPDTIPATAAPAPAAMQAFLDRLMLAESGGRDDARNPRSTAVGPYQFIESTWLEVCRRHFAAETAGLTVPAILALRINRAFARRAAEAFTVDNAAILARNGHASSPANLRLAFLLGAGAAVRMLSADKVTAVIALVGPGVVQANPFMAGMTAADLVAWSARNLVASTANSPQPLSAQTLTQHAIAATPGDGSPNPAASKTAGSPAPILVVTPPLRPKIAVKCNKQLASCQKWIVLAERRAAKPVQVAGRRPTTR